MSDFVEEIKSRLSIEDLVSQYVQLKRAGRSYKGLCPFHSEKTPSFVVSPDKGIAYCFGCHKGGDIFKFVQELENLDFPGAVRFLADKTGVKLEDNFSKKLVKDKAQNDDLFKANEAACNLWVDNLWNTDAGKKVLKYIDNRVLAEETIKTFKLGFGPDSFEETTKALLREGFDNKTLIDAGLVSVKDTAVSHVYDRFRARLMFPVLDVAGRVVAFGGRALKAGDEPKYLNTSDTRVYHKGRVLYGFFQNKKEIKKVASALIVEGYMDFLMSWQEGVKNVVSVSGTALTDRHIKMLKAVCDKLIFAFDSDKAGLQAAKRSFSLVDKQGLQVYMLNLGEFKDPADFALANPGKLKAKIDEAKPFMEVLVEKSVEEFDLSTMDGKKGFLHEVVPFLLSLTSSVEKDFYVRACAKHLQVSPDVMNEELKNFKSNSYDFVEKESSNARGNDMSLSTEEHLLALILAFPVLASQFDEKILHLEFSGLFQDIYKAFLSQYNADRLKDKWVFDYQYLSEEGRQKAMFLMLFGEEENAYLGDHGVKLQIELLIEKMKVELYDRQRKTLEISIKEAQQKGDKEQMLELMTKMRDLLTEKK